MTGRTGQLGQDNCDRREDIRGMVAIRGQSGQVSLYKLARRVNLEDNTNVNLKI
jgi:hypothetical protein